MANKSVYSGIYTIKLELKRMLILLLLGIICLTLVEAQSRVVVERWGFEHSPAQNFIYFKESDVSDLIIYYEIQLYKCSMKINHGLFNSVFSYESILELIDNSSA